MKHWISFSLLLLIGLTLSLSSMAKKSPTYDETAHIVAGYSYLATGDFRLNIEHPPLVKELSALPLLVLRPRFNPDAWAFGDQYELGKKFLFAWNNPQRLVFWARVPVVVLFALLGVLVYCCASEFYGRRQGLLALGLYFTTPDFLAHGQLVTTDLAIALFIFSGVYFFYRSQKNRSWGATVAFALSFGLAFTAKYSASMLLVILLILSLLVLVDRNQGGEPLPRNPEPHRFSRWQWLGIQAGLALFTTWLLIWTVYGFRFSVIPGSPAMFDLRSFGDHGLLTRVGEFLQHWRLLPDAYLGGFFSCIESLHGRVPYFFGTYTGAYWWCFYFVTFLLKTPLPLILLIGLGFVRRFRNGWKRRDVIYLLIPVTTYLTLAVFSGVALYHRYLLPIYPFLIVWAAEAGRAIPQRHWNRQTLVPVALILWQVLGTTFIYPNFLTFFNELGGGPEKGYKYLIDSNFDWGQDLPGLAAYRERHSDHRFFVSYFGSADPSYYLRNVNYLRCLPELTNIASFDLTDVRPGDYVAVSATVLMSKHLETNDLNRRIARKIQESEPVARIGNTILVYLFP